MKTASRESNKTHCCHIAKIQQTLVKVQSHKVTNHQANIKLTEEKENDSFNRKLTKSKL